MTFFFFLPSILLSGFMFPFRGMPGWAQAIGEALPLTHFLRSFAACCSRATASPTSCRRRGRWSPS
jgi:ABC-2 type transport system permease protein